MQLVCIYREVFIVELCYLLIPLASCCKRARQDIDAPSRSAVSSLPRCPCVLSTDEYGREISVARMRNNCSGVQDCVVMGSSCGEGKDKVEDDGQR